MLHKMVSSSSPILDTLNDYKAACLHLATGTPPDLEEIQKSGSSSATLQVLLSVHLLSLVMEYILHFIAG
jgi:hypothetical protein